MAELPTQRDFEDFPAWSGRDVLGSDGERLGAVEQIFLDEATDVPEWVLVRLEDTGAAAFVPLAGAAVEERSIRVDQDRERITAAPQLDVGETLTIAEVRRLYEHYGIAYSQEESPTVLPEGAGAGTASEPTDERPRLRKYVGSPVPPAEAASDDEPTTSSEQPAQAAHSTSDDEPTTSEQPAQAAHSTESEPSRAPDGASADPPVTKGTGPAEPVPHATAPPAPIAPPPPRAIPPEGGFQAQESGEDGSSGPLAVLKRRPALPVTLAGAIAGLIILLALRRRR
jgi:hypothetical protein